MKKHNAFSSFRFSPGFQLPFPGHQISIKFPFSSQFSTHRSSILPAFILRLFYGFQMLICMVEGTLSVLKGVLSMVSGVLFDLERVAFNASGVLYFSKGVPFLSTGIPFTAKGTLDRKSGVLFNPERNTINGLFNQLTGYYLLCCSRLLYKYCLITGGHYFDQYFHYDYTKIMSSLLTGTDAHKNSFLKGMKLFLHHAREDGLAKKIQQ